MPPRRGSASPASQSSESESNSYSESDDSLMFRCLCCEKDYELDDSGTCKECYDKCKECYDKSKHQIEEWKSKVSFLTISSPFDAPSSTPDLILVPSLDTSARYVPAHKAVLVSRSPVFKAMLENDMEESRSGTINITDVSYDTLFAFVNYLYTAEACLDDNQMACNLLALAEKYQVKHLKTNCENHLIAKLTWEKAVANYAFARQHNANPLLDAALALIIDNMDNLTRNEDYMELVDCNPRLIIEIYEAYHARQGNTAVTLTKRRKRT